jgi:hypothetical protein
MPDPLIACFTDAKGYGLFDGRFSGAWGQGDNYFVVSVFNFVYTALYVSQQNAGAKYQRISVNGHGAPGFQALGCGDGDDHTGNFSLQVDAKGELVGRPCWQSLPALRDYFVDGAIVSLRGCAVADGLNGKKLLRALALAWKVSVMAYDATQHHWLPFREGKLWMAGPDGTITCVTDGTTLTL